MIIVYTVNLGGYDQRHEYPQRYKIDGVRYLYYSDQPAPDGWEWIKVNKGGRRESRYMKINSHLLPDHDYSIYIDASYQIQKPLNKLLEDFSADIGLCKHKDNSLVKHAMTCIGCRLDDPKEIFKQVGRYMSENIPDIQVSENSLLVRKNNGIIKLLNETWWEEYSTGSQRDQLSMPYAIWKANPTIQWFPFSARENKYLANFGNHNFSNRWTSNK
jgi:hypothetical protein